MRIAGTIALVLTALVAVAALGTATADARACKPIANPYEGTRYEGIDLRRIRAEGVRCRKARRVVKGAHSKALGITPPAGGVREFTWNGWAVTGDLRPATDRYVAKRRGKRVRWAF